MKSIPCALKKTVLDAVMKTIIGALLMKTVLDAVMKTIIYTRCRIDEDSTDAVMKAVPCALMKTVLNALTKTTLRAHSARGLAEHDTYIDAFLRLNQERHGVESNDGVLDPLEEGATPVDGSSHRRVVLVQWRLVLVLVEQAFYQVHLHTVRQQPI